VRGFGARLFCGASAIGAVNHRAAHSNRRRERSTLSKGGLEQYLADLNISVGDEASTLEALMVEIRVAVPDATRVPGLMRRLAGLFDRSSVSFDGTQREVRVRSDWESRGVVQVLRAVELWLAEDGPDSAKLSIGDRSYTMVGPMGLGAQNGRAA
jgi:hypothetical protein